MHDLLEPNAYWILGLPGNASRRDIVSTASRIRLRLVAGRKLDGDDPFPGHLGVPQLSVAALDALVRKLDDPVYRLQQRLLRYTRSTPADAAAWKELVTHDDENVIHTAWPPRGALDARLNRARWLWWCCYGHQSCVTKPEWHECVLLWGRLVDQPGLFRALAPEAVEATFDNPATEADFIAAVELIPVFLEAMFGYVLTNVGTADDVAPMTEAVRNALLPDAWTQRLLERLWERFFSSFEYAVDQLKESDATHVGDCRESILDQLDDLCKLGAEESPMYQRLRRQAGKALHARALYFEKNGPLQEALVTVQISRYLLEGTPDVVPVKVDEARIGDLVKKAAAAPPPAPPPVPVPAPVAVVVEESGEEASEDPEAWEYRNLLLVVGGLVLCVLLFALASGEPETSTTQQRGSSQIQNEKLYSVYEIQADEEADMDEDANLDEEAEPDDEEANEDGEPTWND